MGDIKPVKMFAVNVIKLKQNSEACVCLHRVCVALWFAGCATKHKRNRVCRGVMWHQGRVTACGRAAWPALTAPGTTAGTASVRGPTSSGVLFLIQNQNAIAIEMYEHTRVAPSIHVACGECGVI